MTTFAGNHVTEVVVTYDPHVSVNMTLARAYASGDGLDAHETYGGDVASVSATPYPGQVAPQTLDGVFSSSFLQDWYYRIHVVPGTLALGNVVSDQSREIVVWNAYLTTADFETIETDGFDGLSLTEPASPPMTLAPLQVLVYDVTVLVAGPPTIDASITWTINGEDYTTEITGRRVVAFPFPPNWKDQVNETLEFRGTLIKSHNGRVQTANVRRKARRIFDYTIQLQGDNVQRAENLIFGWHHRLYAMPVWTEIARLTADAAAGATQIEFDPSHLSFGVGGLITLFQSPTVFEVREVESIDGTTVALTAPLERAWAANSKVLPAFVSALNPGLNGSRATSRILQLPVRFTAEPRSTLSGASGEASATYQGHELCLDRPNWVAGLNISFNSDHDTLDLAGPAFQLAGRSGYSEVRRDHNWWLNGYESIAEFRGWLERRGGLAVPFYMPSGLDDFRLVNDVLDSDTAIDVVQNDYETLVDAHPARRDILIQFRDGSYLALRIASSELTVAGNTRLAFSAPVGVEFTPADVSRISYLSLYRLASNAIVLSHRKRGFVTSTATLVTNRND
jgi:hypothetical protein